METTAAFPIGAGYGMSAAAILATLTAANAVFDLGAEVAHNTGLGDVAAASGGGLTVRTAPGIAGVMDRMFPETELCTITFGSIFTPGIISSPEEMRKVTAAFPDRTPANLAEFMQNSREFAEASGLIPERIRPVLTACDDAGVPASMTMLGCGVFAAGSDARE